MKTQEQEAGDIRLERLVEDEVAERLRVIVEHIPPGAILGVIHRPDAGSRRGHRG